MVRRMRRPVAVAMCGVTGAVVGVSYALSERQPSTTVASGSAAGVVGVVSASSPTPLVPLPTPRATTTSAPSPSAVPRVTVAPRRTAAPKTAAPKTAAPKPAVTVNGAAYDTRYGPVQVQITVRAGRITRSDAIEYPTQDRRDREINSYAIPQLNQEAVDAQSAQIDTVSGATYTSDGYRQSLQSAIDAAHRAGAL